VPIITIIVGEGASGGALGIGVGDRVYMLENTWYSVISPILFFYFMEKLGI
jgi:acetyl-CoA carboxylase carboxyl transferase subunit alpha